MTSIIPDPKTIADRQFFVDKQLAETFFREFFRQAWHVIEPGTEFTPSWYIDAECDHAQAVTDGRIRNLVVNQPPRTLKSIIWSVAWPAWEWIAHPQTRWLYASYALTLSIRDSVRCRRLIESPWYQKRWADRYRLSGDQNVKSNFENNKGGYRIATSVDAAVTGLGAERIVADDPHSVRESESDAVRKATIDWWDAAMSTRLNDQRTGTKVIIMQRVHEDDLSGHVLRKGSYEHLCIPMEYEGPRKPTLIGWQDPRQKRGELLSPIRIGTQQVADLKRDMGSYAASGQLQQRPSPAEGGILKRYWFRYWHHPGQPLPPITVRNAKGEYQEVMAVPLPPLDEEALSFDCAFKGLDTSDFVAGGHWGRRDADKFLMNQRCERMTFTETLECVTSMSERAPRATLKLVEDKANGPAVIDTLRSKIAGIVAVNPQGGKMARAQAVSPQVESGNVYLPHPLIAPWVDGFLDEAAAFPNASHDDQVDQMTQMLLRWQTHSGIFHTSEQSIVCQPMNIPASWKRGAAAIIRGDKVSAVWAATDPASGVTYLTMEYVRAGVDPLYHVSTLISSGKWMPFTIKVADLSEADGRKVAQRYRALGIRAMDAPGEPEAFLQELTQAMGQGRFKCFSQLAQWIEQFRLAGNRPDQKIDVQGDLIAAACLLFGARERMQVVSNAGGPKPDGMPRPSANTGSIGISWT